MLAYIVSDQNEIAGNIRQFLEREGVDCPVGNIVSLGSASEQLFGEKPDLLVMVLGSDPQHTLEVMGQLRLQSPGRVLAVGPAIDPKLMIRALRSGADDYLDVNDLETSLREALPRCLSSGDSKPALGFMIAVLAPSGGSGSSTIAVNVATVLAQEYKRSVLVDMKLEAGDLAALLDLKPQHTLSDLCQNVDRVDQTLFQRTLAVHSSGVRLLAAPATLEDVSFVNVEVVHKIMKLAREGFPYLVVDLDHSFHEEQAEVLRQADIILLVLRMDFTALRNARRTLAYFDNLGIDKKRVRLVINRFGQAKEVPADRAEEVLGVKIFHYVPDDPKTVNRSNNNGVPMVIEDPWAKVSQSISQLTKSLANSLKV